ncbi:MAG: DUF3592 domain-containing protein [Pseudomonadota bacterium]
MQRDLRQRLKISVVLVFFTGLAILGVVSGGLVVTDYARARASGSWQVVEGVMLRARAARPYEQTQPIRYVYSVNGKPFEGARIGFFTGAFAKTPDFSAMPAGARVDVYVSLRDPAFSVLQPGGAGWFFVVSFLASSAAVFIGVGGVVRTLEDAFARGRLVAASSEHAQSV